MSMLDHTTHLVSRPRFTPPAAMRATEHLVTLAVVTGLTTGTLVMVATLMGL